MVEIFCALIGKALDFGTLSEKLVWCVVAMNPKDDTIANLADRAFAKVKKKVGKGATGEFAEVN